MASSPGGAPWEQCLLLGSMCPTVLLASRVWHAPPAPRHLAALRTWRLHAAQLPGWVGVPKLGLAVLAADVDAFNLLLEMKLKRRRERPHLPRTVTELVAEDGSRVYVVGTAHFSDDSKKDVVKVSRPLPAPSPPPAAAPWGGQTCRGTFSSCLKNGVSPGVCAQGGVRGWLGPG